MQAGEQLDPTDSAPADGEAGGNADDPRPRLASLLLGVVLMAMALIGIVDVRSDELLATAAPGPDPGPGFLPEMLMWILGFGGAVQTLLVGYQAWRAGGFRREEEFTLSRLWVPALLLVSIILYEQALRSVGYVVSSVIFAIVWVPIVHWRSGFTFKRRHVVQLPLEAVAIALALYVLFRHGIRVPLP
ncbi:MAG: tripartite tricarboxylate transporter TctB family protein [Hyphomicrobiales bacterium]